MSTPDSPGKQQGLWPLEGAISDDNNDNITIKCTLPMSEVTCVTKGLRKGRAGTYCKCSWDKAAL